MTLRIRPEKGLFILGASIMMVIVFAMVFWDTLNITKISGSYYQRITRDKDLIADILPPPQFIIEPYLIMYQMLDETDKAKLEQLTAETRELRDKYEARHEFWAGTLPEGKTREELIVTSYRPAEEFFEILDKQFMPAILRGDKENAHTLIRDLLTPKYEDHRLTIENVARIAAKAIRREERESAGIVERRVILLVLLGMGIIGLALLHKWAEEQVRCASQYARSLIEASPDPLVTISPKGKITDVNEATVKVTGIRREELIGTDFSNYFTEPELAHEGYRQAFQEGSVTDYPLTIRHRNGSLTHALYNASVYKDVEGNILGVFAAARDITKRKLVEQALHESQQMLQLVLDNIPVRVFWKDLDSNFLGCNRTFAFDAGLESPEEIVGRNDFEMGWAEQTELYRSDDRLVMETGKPKLGYEEPQTTPDGGLIWLRTNKVPFRDTDGRIKGVLGTYEDITESKRMEEKLQASETRYRIVADNTHDWEYWSSPQGRILYVSPSCQRITGYTASEFEAAPDLAFRIVHPDDLAQYEAHVAETRTENATSSSLEFRIVYRDGTIKWIGHVCQPVFDESGCFLGRRGSNRDITDRKKAEKALEESSENLKFFAYSVAHDLKSPAIGIYGLTKRLSKHARDVLDEKGKTYCDQIIKVSEHIATLVEKINIYIATKEVAPLIEKINFSEIVRMIRDEFSGNSASEGSLCLPLSLKSRSMRTGFLFLESSGI